MKRGKEGKEQKKKLTLDGIDSLRPGSVNLSVQQEQTPGTREANLPTVRFLKREDEENTKITRSGSSLSVS
jgi:hypothetical protein